MIAARAAAIAPFQVMRLLERARQLEAQGRRVIHLEIGEPDFPTPEPILEAGREALAAGHTRYTPARGLASLREAIAGYYRNRYAVELDPERILVTPGASGGLQLVLAAWLSPGDAVLMSDPGYPCNGPLVQLFGGQPRAVPVGPETGYQLAAGVLEAHWTPATRLVMVASPANPTGALLEAAALAALYRETRARGASLLVDEIYQGLVYDAPDQTALTCATEDLVVVNSFSKYFGMTGWRLGWVVAPPAAAPVLDRLAQNLYLAAPTLSQHAALAAFAPATLEILEARRREFQRRRDVLRTALEKLGFRFPAEPRGAFYLYADCRQVAPDSERLATGLLEEEAVAVTPGMDFGQHAPRQHLRFAYTTAIESLEEAVFRIGRFLGRGA